MIEIPVIQQQTHSGYIPVIFSCLVGEAQRRALSKVSIREKLQDAGIGARKIAEQRRQQLNPARIEARAL